MKVLVINAGSSSLKYDLYEMAGARASQAPGEPRIAPGEPRIAGGEPRIAGGEPRIAGGTIDRLDGADAIDAAVHRALDQLGDHARDLAAIGHRVVHGGEQLVEPVRIDDKVEHAIEACSEFAPLHNPINLRGIRAARARFPDLPHVAVFDTAFHATIPEHAFLYGLPYDLYLMYGIRRYGFHGPSHRYMALRAAQHLDTDGARLQLITCHLGGGASVAAIAGGASIDTSMGLTPLEGLVMGTRPGDLDPAIPGFLARAGYAPDQIEDLLNHRSGLAGISELGADFRDIAAAAARGHARARLAIDVYIHRIRKYVGAYAVELGGAHAIVFTGGIGEGSAEVRAGVCANLGFMGVGIDAARNAAADPKAHGGIVEISAPGARTRVLVVHTEEERMIARDVVACLEGATAARSTGG